MVFWGIVIVLVVSALAVVGVFLANKFIPEQERKDGEVEAIGFIFAVVGVLYAIVLAFVVIDVWTQLTAVEDATYQEAGVLVEQYRYAETLPAAQRVEVQRLSRDYVGHVIKEEWPQMEQVERVSLDGYALLDQLRKAVAASHPELPANADPVMEAAAQESYANAVAQGTQLAELREQRVLAATSGVPSVLWFLLIGGALLTIAFAYLFDVATVFSRITMAIGLTVMTVLLLWAIYEMEYPFARTLRIGPEAFEFALARFAQITKGG